MRLKASLIEAKFIISCCKHYMEFEELMRVLNNSEIYDLEYVVNIRMPAFQPVQLSYLYYLYKHHENYYKPETNELSTNSQWLTIMSNQSCTYIDALCYQTSNMKLIDKMT
jgi:hypothetical protein